MIKLENDGDTLLLERDPAQLQMSEATVADGADIWSLVRDSGVLDVNSPYSYLMMGKFFSETCVVAKVAGELVGFVNAFRPPSDPEVVFVWQIGVVPSERGKGLGKKLLHELLSRKACADVRYLESTITPSNKPSQALFRSFARELNAECRVVECFPEELFPGKEYEAEMKYRIGPLNY